MPINLPNLLTLSRIVAIPVIVAVLFFHDPLMRWIGLGLFVAAAVTDYFDGYLARHWGQVSRLGRFLDPIADKLLVASIIVMLVATDDVRGLVVIPAIVIVCREILVSGLREFLAEIKVPLPVSRLAKWKTAIQMIALGVLIVGEEAGPSFLPMQVIGDAGLWIAATLTLVTGYDYLARGLKHMG
ncbi:MAG: CDP-diacylglycerol--glycerol-3-phosphate 3-phosphatidyltransferase [Alphaproteobacteria bacterium]|nr:MAG: CDP-diacylglycerol--glycerol-3-phosphate 3-phosphatidyltransferase [Alphaproteobacteria bacterium]